MSEEKARSLARRSEFSAVWLGDAVVRGSGGRIKYDEGKLDYALVDDAAEAEMVAVLTYGATKYEPGNWRKVERERYVAALRRHLAAYRQGEDVDAETGLLHLAHAACCVHFLLGIELAAHPDRVASLHARLDGALKVAREFRSRRGNT